MENKRFALDIGITLSSQLINACLSMLAIIGALFIFIIDRREISIAFYVLISLSFLSFIASVIIGGKGINIVREKSFKGKLKLKYSKNLFNWQAITCIIGILTCIISLFFTNKINEEQPNLNNIIEKFLKTENNSNHKIDSLTKEINLIKHRIDSTKTE